MRRLLNIWTLVVTAVLLMGAGTTYYSLKSTDSPIFANIKLSDLSDGKIPYHIDDATGLADGPTKTDVDDAVSKKHTRSHTISSTSDHSDVNLAAISNNDLMRWDDPSSKWLPKSIAEVVSGNIIDPGNVRIASLTDGYIPYHVDDTTGFVDGPIKTDVDDAVSKKHTQNTDTGTTSTTFQIDSDATGPKLKNSSGAIEIRNEGDTAWADLYAGNVGYNEGMLSDPTIGDAAGVNISITSADCLIRSDAVWNDGKLYRKTVAENTSLAVTDDSINYIYVTWNTGTPIYAATTNRGLINNSDIIPVARVYMDSGDIEYQASYKYIGKGAAVRNFDRVMRIRGSGGIERESGFAITETGTRVVNIASGYTWFGLSRISLDAVVQGVAASELWYHVAGVWTRGDITAYNNTQYDNGTNLAALTPNRYAVNWIYRNITEGEIDIVLGRGDYTLAQAEASTVPPIPDAVANFYVLCGRIIVKNGVDTAYAIQNISTSIFMQASVTAHGDLSGLTTGDDHTQYAYLAGRDGGQILIGGTAVGDDLILRTTSGVGASGANMIFQTGDNGGLEVMRILYNGNVGIGTTGPGQKLDVFGKIAINGTARIYIPDQTDFSGTMYLGNGDGGASLSHTTGDEGRFNTFIGIGSGNANTTGLQNTANGYYSLRYNTTGSYNTANGFQSLYSNTTGLQNTANGYYSLRYNTTGSYNTANGYKSLYYNTTGNNNTANGFASLLYNTTGNRNTANGHYSLYDLGAVQTAGSFVTGISYTIKTVGDTDFTAIGASENTVGITFTASGAGTGTGTATPNGTNSNTAIGYNTGRGIITGSNNTILGANVTGLAANLSNNIIIADGAGNRRINVDSSGKVGIEGPMSLKEIADATTDTAAYGQIWVHDTTPNELWFTDDAGTDTQISSHPLDAPEGMYVYGAGIDWIQKRVQPYLGVIFWQTIDGVVTEEAFDEYNARRKNVEGHKDKIKQDWDTVQTAKIREELKEAGKEVPEGEAFENVEVTKTIEFEEEITDAFEEVEITELIQTGTKKEYSYSIDSAGKVKIGSKDVAVTEAQGIGKFEKRLKTGVWFDTGIGTFKHRVKTDVAVTERKLKSGIREIMENDEPTGIYRRSLTNEEADALNIKAPDMPKWMQDWTIRKKNSEVES